MQLSKFRVLGLIVLIAATASPVFSQDDSSTGRVVIDDLSDGGSPSGTVMGDPVGPGYILIDELGGQQPFGPVYGATPLGANGGYFWLRYDFGDYPGAKDNYGSLGTFLPLVQRGNGLLFGDLQMMIYRDESVGGDLGLGYRYLHEPSQSIFGVNAFLTYDRSINKFDYSQFGFGAEWLWKLFDVRANVYLPFQNEQNPLTPFVAGNIPRLSQSQIIFTNTRLAEQQMRGGDVEIGFPIPGIPLLRAYAGGYTYDATNGESLVGVRGRLGIHTDSLEYYFSVSNDEVFGTNVGMYASIALGKSGIFSLIPFGARTIEDRMFERVEKQHRIAMAPVTDAVDEPAINPATNLPYKVVHVDNNSAGPGDGTLENRFVQLDSANGTNADYVLVWRGNTSSAAPLAAGDGLVMANNQILLGEGHTQNITFDALGKGTFDFPAWGTAGDLPFVTANAGRDIMTLANDNFVAGVNLLAPTGGSGIAAAGITNFELREINREITAAINSGPGSGIHLINAGGRGIIDDVRFNIPNTTAPGGIVIENTDTSPLILTIGNAPLVSGGLAGLRLAATNSTIKPEVKPKVESFLVDSFLADSNGSGLEIVAESGGSVTAIVKNSTFNNAQNGQSTNGHGISVMANSGTVDLTVKDTTATGSAVDGLHIEADSNSTVTGSVTNGSFSNSGRHGVLLDFDTASQLTNLAITDTTADDAGTDGMHIEADNGAALTVDVTNGSFTNAGEDAFDVTFLNGSTVDFTVDPTPATGAKQHGLRFQGDGANSKLTAKIVDSDLSVMNAGTGDDGVNGSLTNEASATLTLDNSDVAYAGVNALNFDVQSGGKLTVNLNNGISLDDAGQSGAGGSAILATVAGTGSSATIQSNGGIVSGANASGNAIDLRAGSPTISGGDIKLNLTNIGSFANAGFGAITGGSGLSFTGDSNTTLDILLRGTPGSPSFDGAGQLTGLGYGVVGVLNNGATATLNLTDTSFANAINGGLSITSNGSQFTGAVTRGNFSGVDSGNGIELFWNNSQTANLPTSDLVLTEVTIDNVAVDALHVEANNSSALDIAIHNSSLINAGGDTYDIFEDGSSTVNLLVDPTPSTGAGQVGLRFDVKDSSTFIATFDSSDLSTSTAPTGSAGVPGETDGIRGMLDTNSMATLTFMNSLVANAGGNGLNVTATNGSNFMGSFTNGSFANATNSGLVVNLDNSIGTLTLDNTDANNAGDDNLQLAITSGGTLGVNLNNGISLDRAGQSSGGSAILANVAGNGSKATIQSTGGAVNASNAMGNVANATGNGLDLTVTNGGSLELNFTAGLTLDDASSNAIRSTSSGTGSTVTVTGDSVSGARASGDGIFLQSSNDGSSKLNLTNAGSFANAGADGIHLKATNALVDVTMTSNGSFTLDGTTGNAVNFTAVDSGTVNLDLAGTAITPLSLSGAQGGSALLGRATNDSTANLTLDRFTANGALGSGLELTADDDDPTAPGSTITGNITNGSFDQNGLHGVAVTVNPDSSINDNSFVDLNFNNVTLNNNTRDGLNVVANNGNDTVANKPNLTGAIVKIEDSQIRNNGNGNVGDGLGNGIDATANGDGLVAGNTQITLNLVDTTIENNEEDQLLPNPVNGGAVNLSFTRGVISGLQGITLDATDNLSLVRFSLNETTFGSNPNGPGLSMIAYDGGIVQADISNVDFNDNAAQGILFAALTGPNGGGSVTAKLTNIKVMRNNQGGFVPGAGVIDLNSISANVPSRNVNVVAAVQGIVDGGGSSAKVNMNSLNVTQNDTLGGFDVAVLTGGTFRSTIQTDPTSGVTTTFSGNATATAADEFNVLVDGAGSSATFDIDGLNVANSQVRALNFKADHAGTLAFTRFDNITAKNAAVEGLNLVTTNNGALTSLAMGGTTNNFDSAGTDGININLGGQTSPAMIGLTNVTANTAGGTGVNIAMTNVTGGASSVALTNVTADDAVAGGGVSIALTGVTGGNHTVSLDNVSAQGAGGGEGLNIDVTGLGATDSVAVNVLNSNFSHNVANTPAADTVNIAVGGVDGSAGSIMLTDVTANNGGQDGVDIELNNATGAMPLGANSGVTLTHVVAQGARRLLGVGGQGLNLDVLGVDAGATVDVAIASNTNGLSDFSNAATDGVSIRLSGDAVATSNANLTVNGLAANAALGGSGVDLFLEGNIAADVSRFDNVTATNAFGHGVNVDATAATAALKQFVSTIGVDVSNAGANGVNLALNNQNVSTNINLDQLTANNANITGVGISLTDVTSGSSVVRLANLTADDVLGGPGVQIALNGVSGANNAITLDNVSAQRARAGEGLYLNAALSNSDSLAFTILNGSNFSYDPAIAPAPAADAVRIALAGPGAAPAASATVTVGDATANAALTANNSGARGIDFELSGNLSVDVNTFNNVFATDAALEGLNLDAPVGVALTQFLANGTDFSNAGTRDPITGLPSVAADAVNMNLDTQATGTTISFENLTADNATGKAVDIGLTNITGGTSRVSLTDVTATDAVNLGGTVATDGSGLELTMVGTSPAAEIALTRTDFSRANNGDVIQIGVNGLAGTTALLDFDTVTANNVIGNRNTAGDGIDLALSNGVIGTINTFTSVTATQNAQNGMKIDVSGGSTLQGQGGTPFAASNVILSDNGTQGFDGLDISVHGTGSTAAFDFTNLITNNSGGRGLDLDVFDGGSLTFDVTGGTINSSGREGIDINVGVEDDVIGGAPVVKTPGTFSGMLSGVVVTNSGSAPVLDGDGINVDVRGSNGASLPDTSINLVLDDVTADSNEGNGIQINVVDGATGTFVVTNSTTASSNTKGGGFSFAASGANTTVSLISSAGALGGNAFDNNLADHGFSVNLTDQVHVTDLTLDVSANGNADPSQPIPPKLDGVRIVTDASGVEIDNFNVSGTGLTVNNNSGNGLFVDLNNVTGTPGVESFTLANMTVQGNQEDQIHVNITDMTLKSFVLSNITINNPNPTSGDGIEVNLNGTTVTDVAPTNPPFFLITNVTSNNNGGYGLNLIAGASASNPSAIVGGSGGVSAGVVQNSSFSNNGKAGFNAVLGGTGTYEMDFINNPNSFANNSEQGIRIEVKDTATFNMQRFYNNRIEQNQRIGLYVLAREIPENQPSDGIGVPPFGGPPYGPRYSLTIGDANQDPNFITQNGDAAVAIDGRNDSRGTLTINNSILIDSTDATFTSSPDLPKVDLQGDGLAVLLEDSAVLDELIVDGSGVGAALGLNSNAGSGLYVAIRDKSKLGTVSRMQVLNSTFQGNSQHGVRIERRDDSLFGPDINTNQILIGVDDTGVRGANIFQSNTLNGLDLLHNNKPGSPPLDIKIEGNQFNANQQDGLFTRLESDAILTGNVTDNTFNVQGRDGIHFQVNDNGKLGNPNDPSGTPMLVDGNIIDGADPTTGTPTGRYGVFFETDMNENGIGGAGGTAFVNVLVTGGDNALSSASNARTQVGGMGQDGVRIHDESNFNQIDLPSAPILQNTYTVNYADIANNAQDGIHVIAGGQRTGNKQDTDAGLALNVGDPAAPGSFNTNVNISGNGDDGIDFTANNALRFDTAPNIDSRLTVARTTISFNGDDGVRVAVTNADSQLALERVRDSGQLTAGFQTLDVTDNGGDGFDFLVDSERRYVDAGTGAPDDFMDALSTPEIGVSAVTMTGVSSMRNAGRGLNAFLQHDFATQNVNGSNTWNLERNSQSLWNIGQNGASPNRFYENGREGVVFDSQAKSLDQRAGVDVNRDVYVEVVLTPQPTNQYRPSTKHEYITGGTVAVPVVPPPPWPLAPIDPNLDDTRVHLTANVNVINNQIASNGQNLANPVSEDGLVLAVGDLTRMNANVSGNSFGGNAGKDIHIYPQRSNGLNPPQSDNTPPLGWIVYDPVAYLDLVLGSVDTNGDTIPDTDIGNGRYVTNVDFNRDGVIDANDIGGDEIFITTLGVDQTSSVTVDGEYDNADPIKGPEPRPVRLGALVQIAVRGTLNDGIADNETFNDFRPDNISPQPLDGFFDEEINTFFLGSRLWPNGLPDGFLQNLAQPFPESSTTFPAPPPPPQP